VLRSSGIRAFENVISAYLFSGIPIALAACLKALSAHIEDSGRRRVYTLSVWGIGFLFGMTWAFLFANTFPGLTQSTADLYWFSVKSRLVERANALLPLVFILV
jgi:hypothetical protein